MNKKNIVALIASLATCGSLPPSCGQTEISILTYNVHGLPESITGNDQEGNMRHISPLLNSYDVAAIQEDFFYHPTLAASIGHRYQTPAGFYIQKGETTVNPSGLSLFSKVPIEDYFLERWSTCNGTVDQSNDCFAPKGVSVAEIEVIPNTWIDVYNCHMDAGSSAGDSYARDKQVLQLVSFLNLRSPYRAVIVACDTNMDEKDELQLEELLSLAGLKDSCRELNCPEPYNIDRIMYKSGIALQLEPQAWYIPNEFVNEKREDLSDHKPVAVDFRVKVEPTYLK